MVTLTIVEDMLSLCLANTAETVPMSMKAHTEYGGTRTFNCDEKRIIYLFTINLTEWKSIKDKNTGPEYLAPDRLPYVMAYCVHPAEL